VRWSRTPGHDHYWAYRDAFFDLLPRPAERAIEIGCGEGRVARDLAARGHRIVGVDSSSALVRHARETDLESSYVVADGAAVPCASASFDLAVAYNSLQVVSNMSGTVREAARLLRSGGHFCLCISHPVTDMGRFVEAEHGEVFALRQPYFESQRVDETVEWDGLPMTFRGWTYTLEDYFSSLTSAGLVVEQLREPKPADASTRFERWQRVPLFMMVRTVKP
jgi:ubiquinone/menaquinone biosynthesis C-methylase UbiE